MRRFLFSRLLLALAGFSLACSQFVDRRLPASLRDLSNPCDRHGAIILSASERAGCEIWFKATGGNSRFFSSVYPQRLGTFIDWYEIFKTQGRDTRFSTWGLMNDPACCRPGEIGCPAKSPEETYGWDFCPGDDQLLAFLEDRTKGYRDPACDFLDAPPRPGDPHDPKQRQSACDLEFGTSTGAMGFRKFPNPRFDRAKWLAVNQGKPDAWEGYRLPDPYKLPPEAYAARKAAGILPPNPLADGSIEPPFRIGMACGACHIAFDPLHPPADPNHPRVQNLSGTVGNQYLRVMQIFVSGMPRDSLQWQVFAFARPGTADTSAIPTDQVNNPGAINALINLAQRPTFAEDVIRWQAGPQCPAEADERGCWCEPGKPRKCWQRIHITQEQAKADASLRIHHVIKGGEDSVGMVEALLRVYFNIGVCGGSALVNHLADLWQPDPRQRGFGQTPMDLGQARRDCSPYRALEDRRYDLLNFLLTGRPSDLREAREAVLKAKNSSATYTDDDLRRDLEQDLQADVERGRRLFATRCATCHSSLSEQSFGPFLGRDFGAVDPETGLRLDWLGNDELTPVTELATNASRALHSNHLRGHIWEEFASRTYGRRDPVGLPVPTEGGRGYYRNVSLLSLWAHAPLLHNNAVGPELCGGPSDQFYRSPYVDQENRPLPASKDTTCWLFDPSVEGRYTLYKASMRRLLKLDLRHRKVPLTDQTQTIGPLGLAMTFPKHRPAVAIGNFRYKDFLLDVQRVLADPGSLPNLAAAYAARFPSEERNQVAQNILQVFTEILAKPETFPARAPELVFLYRTSDDLVDNKGHPRGHPFFVGQPLTDQDINDLIAFLATV